MSKGHRFSEADLKSMGLVKGEDGKFRAKTKEEKKRPSVLKKPKQPTDTKFNIEAIQPQGSIFIPGNVTSSKNSQKLYINKHTGRPGTGKSDQCKAYIKATKLAWESYAFQFQKMLEGKRKPFLIGFHFVYSTHQKWDYHNMSQLPADLMQEYKWIDDDDKNTMIPIYKPYSIDRFNPGVYITVLNGPEDLLEYYKTY